MVCILLAIKAISDDDEKSVTHTSPLFHKLSSDPV